VKPARFRYARPRALAEALEMLVASEGEAKVLAGGQSLVPMMNMRLVRPSVLVDVNGLTGLAQVSAAPDGGLVVGALARHSDLLVSPLVRERVPLLAEAARHIGHRAIRNRGTLGGSLAHADPAAELPAVTVVLEAEMIVGSQTGLRRLAAADFFQGLLTTALRADEVLLEVRFPPSPRGWGFAELARRPGDFALAGVVGVIDVAAGAPPSGGAARLVGFGIGPRPLRLGPAEEALAGAELDAGAARRAGRAARAACNPADDLHASGEYRRHLAGVLTERVVADAIARLRRRTPWQ
jgi:carbon-monoxide dehydrogenase medium subunit